VKGAWVSARALVVSALKGVNVHGVTNLCAPYLESIGLSFKHIVVSAVEYRSLAGCVVKYLQSQLASSTQSACGSYLVGAQLDFGS
jgi:hypothetical protein